MCDIMFSRDTCYEVKQMGLSGQGMRDSMVCRDRRPFWRDRPGRPEEVTFALNPVKVQKSIPAGQNSMCKGPGAGGCLVCSKHCQKASVVQGGQGGGRQGQRGRRGQNGDLESHGKDRHLRVNTMASRCPQ